MSRQRDYQLRHSALGLCVKCADPAWRDGAAYCQRHRELANAAAKAKRKAKKWSGFGKFVEDVATGKVVLPEYLDKRER